MSKKFVYLAVMALFMVPIRVHAAQSLPASLRRGSMGGGSAFSGFRHVPALDLSYISPYTLPLNPAPQAPPLTAQNLAHHLYLQGQGRVPFQGRPTVPMRYIDAPTSFPKDWDVVSLEGIPGVKSEYVPSVTGLTGPKFMPFVRTRGPAHALRNLPYGSLSSSQPSLLHSQSVGFGSVPSGHVWTPDRGWHRPASSVATSLSAGGTMPPSVAASHRWSPPPSPPSVGITGSQATPQLPIRPLSRLRQTSELLATPSWLEQQGYTPEALKRVGGVGPKPTRRKVMGIFEGF